MRDWRDPIAVFSSQSGNLIPPNPSFDESDYGPSSKGQGSIQNLKVSTNRQTDTYLYINMWYKESQRRQIIFEKKYKPAILLVICKIFWIPIPIELETLHLSHEQTPNYQL